VMRRIDGSRPISRSTSIEEEMLAEAEVRLYQAKVDAMLGMRYDPDEYDQIVYAYRVAKRRADAGRLAAQQISAAGSTKSFPKAPPHLEDFSADIAA
jgi:hypothetical protein